jgi:hypothetical protein
MNEPHGYKQQSQRPSQDAAKPDGYLVLFAVRFFCDHIKYLSGFELDAK